MRKPIDHLRPEGEIEFIDKHPYKPAERVIATKPQDNLFVSGEFNGKVYSSLLFPATNIHSLRNFVFYLITLLINEL